MNRNSEFTIFEENRKYRSCFSMNRQKYISWLYVRLVRKICPKCKREREFNKEEKEIITKIMEKYGEKVDLEGQKTYDAVGCDYCNNTGFYSRIGIFETLDVTDEIRELIVRGASSMEIRQKALETGYRPLVVDGIKKVIEGVTTLEELNKKILMY